MVVWVGDANHPLHETRADFSKLFDSALIVAEKEWQGRARSAPSLGALLARHARTERMSEPITERPWKERPLGSDYERATYLLDTKVVSVLAPRRHVHPPDLIEWLERNGSSLSLSVLTISEMDASILKLRRDGKTLR